MKAAEQAAKLMADRFWNDPGIQAQMQGVAEARRLFELQCLGQLEAYQDLGLLSLYEHFGFRVIDAPRAESIDLTCYCMAHTLPMA